MMTVIDADKEAMVAAERAAVAARAERDQAVAERDRALERARRAEAERDALRRELTTIRTRSGAPI